MHRRCTVHKCTLQKWSIVVFADLAIATSRTSLASPGMPFETPHPACRLARCFENVENSSIS